MRLKAASRDMTATGAWTAERVQAGAESAAEASRSVSAIETLHISTARVSRQVMLATDTAQRAVQETRRTDATALGLTEALVRSAESSA